MQRLRTKGSSSAWVSSWLEAPHLRKKVNRSWAAVQDTYFSTKDLFEKHRVVFTIGTSLASVATAWGGYSLRHFHESRVDQRLERIEKSMEKNYNLEHEEFKKLVDPGSSKIAASVASAGTAFFIGYFFGWRGGRWYANRKFRQEQMKLLGQLKTKMWPMLGQIKPGGWKFQFIKRRLTRPGATESASNTSEKMIRDTPRHNSGQLHQSC